MKRLEIHPLAEKELNDAIDYYESCARNLGLEFLDEVEDSFNSISSSPSTWAAAADTCQRFLLKRFPYAVIYREEKTVIEILAISHNHRRPKYWVERS